MARRTRVFLNQGRIQRQILAKARKDDEIIFGARSIQKQIGGFSRSTEDFDIFTKKPKDSANLMDKKLDKVVGFDFHYVKKGRNPGTWKVKNRGSDFKKGTRDDGTTIDYTKTPKPVPKTVRINGLRYRALSEEIKGKKRAIADPRFKFRKAKDTNDLTRIQAVQGANKFFNKGIIVKNLLKP